MRRREFLQVAPAGLLVNDSSGPLAMGTEGILSTFPPGFVWGVSSSALQIEGALEADGRGPSIWDQIKGGEPARGPEPAAGHYHRWPDDIRLLQDLGVAAYRFSIAWPRVLPEELEQSTRRGSTFMTNSLMGCSRPASHLGFACTTGICPRPFKRWGAGSSARLPIASSTTR